MNRLILVTLAATGSLAMSGCNKSTEAAVDTSKVVDTIKAQEMQWQKGYEDKDVNLLAGEYADDAAVASPGDAVATNDVDRRKVVLALISDPSFKLSFATDQVRVASAGDMASSRGHYTLTMTDKTTNKPVTTNGTYLTVYQKQGDGSFKAVEDVIIPGPAAKVAAK